MSRRRDIIFERETANDATATVVGVWCASGAIVEPGQHLFDIETSKATQEIVSPIPGLIVHELSPGDIVKPGAIIARVDPDASEGIEAHPTGHGLGLAPSSGAPEPGPARSVRVSRDAARLLAENGLAPSDFAEQFVTSQDVRKRLAGSGSRREDIQPLPPHKREEIAVLGRGPGATMLSVVGAVLPVAGVSRHEAGFFETRILDLVAFEASRLMQTFKKLNAAYRPDGIQYHGSVNAGIAFDGMDRLVVYGVENSDQRTVADIQDQIMLGLRRYTRGELTGPELTRATFSITDLSAVPLDFLFPLIPDGQSCIIGITKDADRRFRLFVGFDHRVTEGRDAARFLAELIGRLTSHLASQLAQPHCAFCNKTLEGLAGRSLKGLLQVRTAEGASALCCAECWSSS
jgi:pyruvate/2-oxoglutarate dehydrogenase complex dihydrolipoamide acyltransferase (E2) component